MHVIGILLVLLLSPITIPGWAIEGLLRRIVPKWEFSPYTATPYFLVLTFWSSYAILFWGMVWKWTGIYILTTMEILALSLCISIGIGKESALQDFIRRYADRINRNSVGTTLTTHGLYMSFAAFFYTIHYFAAINYMVYVVDLESFVGIVAGSPLTRFIDFIYYSCTTLTTHGSQVYPLSALAKFLSAIELLIGIGFFV